MGGNFNPFDNWGLFSGGDSSSSPSQPTASGSVQDWASQLPAIYQAQLQYAPQQAAQQVDLANQYAGAYGQAIQKANAGMYPITSQLQEQMAGQAQAGMQSDVPDWMKQQYKSNVNAQLGSNAASPIGADYMSRGLMQQQQDWKQYYQNMGLSLAGRQPLTQAQTPSTTDYMSNYTPSSVMGFNANTYGTAMSGYGAAQTAAANQQGAMYGAMGTLGGAAIKAGMFSSARYKDNIIAWE